MGSCRYVGIFGKRVSSLCCGHFSDKYGRTKTLMGNCVFMIVGGRRIKLLAIFMTIGILVPAITFFFVNTSSDWRYVLHAQKAT
ncbi:hypothetical protein GQ600_23245 [Phytophthora cactorum]|nr:hypothetical protein GQ600_23245 [Phytophthora cactorum]